MKPSRLLAHKDERDILYPEPLPFVYGGRTFDILPMPDSKLMRVGDAIGEVAGVVSGIVELLQMDGASGFALADHVPSIIKTLIPCSSQIAEIALDIPREDAKRMPLVYRIEMLTLILKAEDAPLLLKKLPALMAVFQTEPEAQPTADPEEMDDETDSD